MFSLHTAKRERESGHDFVARAKAIGVRPLLLIALLGQSACGGGGGAAGPPPIPGPVTVTPAKLIFLGTGSSVAQSFTAAEANYSGAFSVSSSDCTGIARAALASGSAATFTITPVGAGACAFSVAGAPGQSQSVVVSVTSTAVGGY